MATVDLQSVTSNLLKLDSSPVKLDSSPMNHASAVIDDLESADRQSEEVSVDVHITKEDVGSDEHVVLQEEQVTTEQVTEETVTEVEEQVIRNGTSSPEEDDVSDITDSDDELEKDVTDQKETFITKTTTTKRRSQRIKKQHEACSGALFSDDELPSPEPLVEVDGVSTTSSQDDRAAERKSLALKIFIIFILLAVVSNTLAYLYLSYPSISDTISGLFQSAAHPDSPQAEL